MLSNKYLAGLIDGEGYIGIIKVRRPKWKGRMNIELTPRVQINMTRAHDLLEEIKNEYNGRMYPKKRAPSAPSHWAETEQLYIEGKKTLTRLLNNILPYLRLKRKQAELILEYFKYASPHGINSEKNLPHQFRIYNELRKLNWRGKGEPPLLRLEDHVRPRKRQGKPPLINRNELFDLYWNKNLLPIEIAEIKGCTNWWISVLLKRYGIPRRGRSESMKLIRKKGILESCQRNRKQLLCDE